ncbi:MAG TPA: GTPase HflX [Clostridia bacterium]|nr:GTPase HflX [Clostridia bacterium]
MEQEQKQNAMLVGVNINRQPYFRESMEELKELAAACEFDTAGQIEQNLKTVDKAFYIGPGKVEEVKAALDETGIEVLIFDNELSPSQLRNLEKALDCSILDRTALILEIFARRAKTREAKLQVEVARLKYMLPRLVGMNGALDRQYGGVGTMNRGAGEKKLVLDRRRIEARITELERELEVIANERRTQRKRRSKSGLPTVALVGYTNAGKSTVMNSMVELSQKPDSKKVFEKDMLFATLETSVRNIVLPDNKAFLLSDTVGFVSKLPHDLVKAFRSTLEEVKEADLLLHVVDASNPDCERQKEVADETLKQIGAGDIPIIYVYNKIDLTESGETAVRDNNVYISARNKDGLEELIGLIKKKIFGGYVVCRMLIPYGQGNIVSYFRENASVKSVNYRSRGVLLEMECRENDFKRYEQYLYS